MCRHHNRSPFIFLARRTQQYTGQLYTLLTTSGRKLHFEDYLTFLPAAYWLLVSSASWSAATFAFANHFYDFLSEHDVGKQRTSVWQSAFAVYRNQFFCHSVSERMMLFFCGFGCSDSICAVYMVSAVCLAFRFVSTDISSSFVLLQLFLCLSVYI